MIHRKAPHWKIKPSVYKTKCVLCGREFKKGDLELAVPIQSNLEKYNVRICSKCIADSPPKEYVENYPGGKVEYKDYMNQKI